MEYLAEWIRLEVFSNFGEDRSIFTLKILQISFLIKNITISLSLIGFETLLHNFLTKFSLKQLCFVLYSVKG